MIETTSCGNGSAEASAADRAWVEALGHVHVQGPARGDVHELGPAADAEDRQVFGQRSLEQGQLHLLPGMVIPVARLWQGLEPSGEDVRPAAEHEAVQAVTRSHALELSRTGAAAGQPDPQGDGEVGQHVADAWAGDADGRAVAVHRLTPPPGPARRDRT